MSKLAEFREAERKLQEQLALLEKRRLQKLSATRLLD